MRQCSTCSQSSDCDQSATEAIIQKHRLLKAGDKYPNAVVSPAVKNTNKRGVIYSSLGFSETSHTFPPLGCSTKDRTRHGQGETLNTSAQSRLVISSDPGYRRPCSAHVSPVCEWYVFNSIAFGFITGHVNECSGQTYSTFVVCCQFLE